MKGKRFKEEQIIRILHEAERGLTVAEVWYAGNITAQNSHFIAGKQSLAEYK
jgi:hypothetical protein